MSLKSRIEALILQINNAKTLLRSALSNKGVSVPISPTWDQIAQGINDIEIPVMPKVSLSFSSGTYSVYLEGNNFNISQYTVYYNGRIKFNPGTISSIVEWRGGIMRLTKATAAAEGTKFNLPRQPCTYILEQLKINKGSHRKFKKNFFIFPNLLIFIINF